MLSLSTRDCIERLIQCTLLIRKKNHGFSLIELVVSMSIVGILIGLAAPSFAALIARNQVITQSNAILESLYLARNHAIAQQTNVHICQLSSAKSQTCSTDRNYNSKWSAGWLVFADNNDNNNFDPDDTLIRQIDLSDSINIVFNQRGRLRFFPNGGARSTGFYICDRLQKHYRHVFLLHTGRARINHNLSNKQKAVCSEISSKS